MSEERASLVGADSDPRESYNPTRSRLAETISESSLEGDDIAISAMQSGTPELHFRRVVGRGGFGEVWEAMQRSLDRTVAVKRIRRGSVCLDPAQVRTLEKAFTEEAFLTARLEHPNIVPVHDLVRDADGHALLAMKFVKGTPWDEALIADFSSLPRDEYIRKHLTILVSVAQAVAFAHARGVVHRDLKASQVMLGEFGEVLLMDWGLAIVYDEQSLTEIAPHSSDAIRKIPTTITASNPAGTPAFMAPEQTEKTAARIGPWTDVYLLGGTLYHMLTGCLPHPGTTTDEAFVHAMMGIVTPPSKLRDAPRVPEELERLVMEALHWDPTQRVPSAREFAARLQAYLNGASRRADSDSIVDRASQPLPPVTTYRDYGERLLELERARELFPDNPRIAGIERDLQVAFVEKAVANHDLVLARTQWERVRDRDAALGLEPLLDAAERRRARVIRQRRISTAAAAVLAVAVLWMGGQWGRQAERARVEALALRDSAEAARLQAIGQRDAAVAARKDSTALVMFMLDDLGEDLRTVDPELRLLQSTVDRAVAHFRTQYAASLAPDEQVALLGGVQRVVSLLMTQGRVDTAAEVVAEARAFAEREAAANPTHVALAHHVATLRGAQADIAIERGELAAFASETLAVEGMLRGLLEGSEDAQRRDLRESLVVNAGRLATAAMVQARHEDAVAALEGGLAMAEALAAESPGDTELRRNVAVMRGRLADTFVHLGREDEADREYRAVAELLQHNEPDPIEDLDRREYLAVCYGRIARRAMEADRADEGLAHFRKAHAEYAELARLAPSSVPYRRDGALCALELGKALRRSGQLGDAETVTAEAFATAERLLAEHPDDPSLPMLSANAHWHRAALRTEQERFADAEADLDAAARIFMGIAEADFGNAFALTDVVNVGGDLLDAVARAGSDSKHAASVKELLAFVERARESGGVGSAGALDRRAVALRLRAARAYAGVGDDAAAWAELEAAAATADRLAPITSLPPLWALERLRDAEPERFAALAGRIAAPAARRGS